MPELCPALASFDSADRGLVDAVGGGDGSLTPWIVADGVHEIGRKLRSRGSSDIHGSAGLLQMGTAYARTLVAQMIHLRIGIEPVMDTECKTMGANPLPGEGGNVGIPFPVEIELPDPAGSGESPILDRIILRGYRGSRGPRHGLNNTRAEASLCPTHV